MNNFSKTGYAVIKQWLTEEEIKIFLEDYKNSTISDQETYQVIGASEHLLKQLKPKIMSVCAQTGLNVDLLTPTSIYTDTSWTNWDWHQDHESYYTLQQSTNYLNFYVVLAKESETLSGLGVIPLDKLAEAIPNQMDKFINKGARRLRPENDITVVHCDETGNTFNIPVNIDTIAVYPKLTAGDLLLIRGDVIHKTQDASTKRTALSIRCTQGSAVITKEKLLAGCNTKTFILQKRQADYDNIISFLDSKDIVTAADLYPNFK